ncbi:MAG: hypothetical protein ACD_9C00112G0003 [uncultured bacterium]|nr:MAG: hypothetical protein ACD_9C00112G0003 [uncultured bacterium]
MKKRTEDGNRMIDAIFNVLGLSLLVLYSIRGLFKADIRTGTVSRKFQITQHSFKPKIFAWGTIYCSEILNFNMVAILDDYGEELRYRVDNDEIYESILANQCIRFKCLRGRIIEVFADSSETQSDDDFCANAQAA